MTDIPVSQEMAESYRYMHAFGKETLGVVMEDFETYAASVIAFWSDVESSVGEDAARKVYEVMNRNGLALTEAE